MFSKKWVIFQKTFSIKLSYFPMFCSNFKWVEKQLPNFLYLACYEIELFSKNNGKQYLNISNTFYVDQK